MKPETEVSWYKILNDGIEIFLYIQPGSKKNEIIGLYAGKLKVKINSVPNEGKANKELISYLSSICNIPKSLVVLKKGKSSRIKTVFIQCEPPVILSVLNKSY